MYRLGKAVLALGGAWVLPAAAAASEATLRVGDSYEITLTRETATQGTDGSSSSSHDTDTIVERVLRLRPDGIELEYDLPFGTSKEEKATNWQFPARVFKPSVGPIELLNRDELAKRVDAWLKGAGWPRSFCGQWIFTWNAFRIECDPESALKAVKAFNLPSAVRSDEPYNDNRAIVPAPWREKKAAAGTKQFVTELKVDPAAILKERAESDVVVGEILKRPVSVEAALAKHNKDAISGTISVTLDVDVAGDPWRRTRLITLNTKRPDGSSETETIAEILERRRISR